MPKAPAIPLDLIEFLARPVSVSVDCPPGPRFFSVYESVEMIDNTDTSKPCRYTFELITGPDGDRLRQHVATLRRPPHAAAFPRGLVPPLAKLLGALGFEHPPKLLLDELEQFLIYRFAFAQAHGQTPPDSVTRLVLDFNAFLDDPASRATWEVPALAFADLHAGRLH